MYQTILKFVKQFKFGVQKEVESSLTNVDVDALKPFHLLLSVQILKASPISLKILKNVL